MDYKSIMYYVGQLVRCVYGSEIPSGVESVILRKPIKGIGIMTNKGDLIKAADQDEVMRLINKLPADIKDPDAMSLECQGQFWIGYHHYAKMASDCEKFGADELTLIGKALYGEQWQTNLARDLNLSDARRVRAWLKGERKIPRGIWFELGSLLEQRKLTINAILDRIKEKEG